MTQTISIKSILAHFGYVPVSELATVQKELAETKKTVEVKERLLCECEEKLYHHVQDIASALRPLVRVNGDLQDGGYRFGIYLSFEMLHEIYNQMFGGTNRSPAYEYFLRGIYHNIERDITALLRLKK